MSDDFAMPPEKKELLLKIMLYAIICPRNPMTEVDRVIEGQLLRSSRASPEEFVRAADLGLAGSEKLSQLLPMDHSESVVREYLQAVRNRLAARLESSKDRQTTS
jgi:hypothetical protein